jgi:hypothetical protein
MKKQTEFLARESHAVKSLGREKEAEGQVVKRQPRVLCPLAGEEFDPMRRLQKTFLILCPLFAALGLVSLASALGAQAAAWQPYSNAEDGFHALFPSAPETSKTSVPVGPATYALRSYTVEVGETALYIGVCDYGPKGAAADPEVLLKSAKDGEVEHMSAQILSEKKIALDSNHGVEFVAESDKLHFTARVYIAGGVLYQTMVISPLGESFADTARFLDSFGLMARPQAAAVAAAEWKPYRYSAEGFGASFPSTPAVEKQSVPTDAGAFDLETFEAEDGASTLIAAVCDYGAGAKDKDPDSLLENAKAGAVSNIKGHLASEKKITLGTNHGVAFEADSESAHISARIYLVGTTLYQTIVASPNSAPYADSARFFDSFQLIERSAK